MVFENIYNKKKQIINNKVLDILINSYHYNKIYICFMIGKYLHMPDNPNYYNYFFRFNSKISKYLIMPIKPYIKTLIIGSI